MAKFGKRFMEQGGDQGMDSLLDVGGQVVALDPKMIARADRGKSKGKGKGKK